MKKLRVKKEYGAWYYEKETPDKYSDLDGPIWHLYDSDGNHVNDFAYYDDMRMYVKTGLLV